MQSNSHNNQVAECDPEGWLEDIEEEDDDDESPRAQRKMAKLERELEKDEEDYL